jgi:hypothetical protein
VILTQQFLAGTEENQGQIKFTQSLGRDFNSCPAEQEAGRKTTDEAFLMTG